MPKYISKFYFLVAAMATSTIVNMIYNINKAFADVPTLVPCPMAGSSTVMEFNTSSCGSRDGWWYPGYASGSRCGSGNAWTGFCASYGRAGWSCTGSVQSGWNESGYCKCSSSFITYFDGGAAAAVGIDCGVAYSCEGVGVVSVACNTADTPGYKSGTAACVCCPKITDAGNNFKLYSAYNASAASDCYVVGTLQDETGLYQYTDDNRCYYAS